MNKILSKIIIHLVHHVGFDTYTVVPAGNQRLMNAAAIRRAPVPDNDWTVATRFSLIAGLSAPRIKEAVRALNSASPSIGMYLNCGF